MESQEPLVTQFSWIFVTITHKINIPNELSNTVFIQYT